MPHLMIEYSANIEARLEPQRLAEHMHEAALDTGVFPIGGLRTRCRAYQTYCIADNHEDNAYVHAVMRMGHGRDMATKQDAGNALFEALCGYLNARFGQWPLAVSFEIQELDPVLNFKQNNLHERVKARAAEDGG